MADKRFRGVVRKYAKELLRLYKSKLKEDNVKASGGLLNTTQKVSIDKNGPESVYNVIFEIEDYWEYVEDGRLSGSFPPIDAIKAWIQQKNIIPNPFQLPSGKTVIPTENQLAFLIGRKIFNDGISPRPYLLESQQELYDVFMEELQTALAEDFEEEITKELENDI